MHTSYMTCSVTSQPDECQLMNIFKHSLHFKHFQFYFKHGYMFEIKSFYETEFCFHVKQFHTCNLGLKYHFNDL